MPDPIQNVFTAARFQPAGPNCVTYVKRDPRGPEYGSFIAWQTGPTEFGVRHDTDDYELRFFTERHFRNWASACT